jgi:hypothetical protein
MWHIRYTLPTTIHLKWHSRYTLPSTIHLQFKWHRRYTLPSAIHLHFKWHSRYTLPSAIHLHFKWHSRYTLPSTIHLQFKWHRRYTLPIAIFFFQNPILKTNALRNSCEDMSCCWSECIVTFHYAGHTISLWYPAVRLVYPLLFCTLHFTSNPINKNLTWRSMTRVKGSIGGQIHTPVEWNT